MYIDKVPNRNSPPAYLLREAWREGTRIRKRTIANLSKWPPEKIERFRRLLKNEPLVHPNEAFAIESSKAHGHVEIILKMLRRLKLPTLLDRRNTQQRKLILAMVVQRILKPQSKLATARQLTQTTLAEELELKEVDENDLYRAMDWLHARQSKIEQRLLQRHLSDSAQVLYDVSSSYYEGHHCPLVRFGYSRDGKRGRPIVVYGILADASGRPLALQAYPGNTKDTLTVGDQIEKLQQQNNLKNIVLVGDRGMLTQTQINALKEHPGVGWISALTHDGICSLVQEGEFQPSLFDRFDLAEIESEQYPGERLVVCFNPMLHQRRSQQREQLLENTEKALRRIQREVKRRTKKQLSAEEIAHKVGRVSNQFKMAKHFDCTIAHGRFEFQRNLGRIEREHALDGFYILRTSENCQQLSPEEVVRSYKNLGKVEQAFRALKSIDLQIRPIRHRTEARVRAHLFICMLAYYVQWHLKEALQSLLYHEEEPDPRHNPVAPPTPSDSLQRKKSTHQTEDGLTLHSFSTLMDELGTRCRNQCRLTLQPEAPLVALITQPSPIQKRALELVKTYPVA